MTRSLQDALDDAGDALLHLRSHKFDRNGPPQYFPARIVPQIPFEFSNWYREGLAWRESVALLDQTHHMNGLRLKGPDTLTLIKRLACNDLSNTTPGRAHQIVICNEDGHLLGEDILFHLAPDDFYVCGVPFALNWIHYQVQTSGLDIEVIDDSTRSPVYANGHANTRQFCRYQIQGPKAWTLIEKLNGGPVADVKFFHLTEVTVAGHRVSALRHGMAGAPGLEISAPWELRDELREAIIEAGREFGLVLVGGGAYLIGGLESGYIPWCVPGIYTSPEMEAYRRWLSADELEAELRLGGSHLLPSVEDYYLTPYEFGYSHLVHLEHDFIGRDALAKIGKESGRKKVTILWNVEDATALFAEMLSPDGEPCKPFSLPGADKTDITYDSVTVDDRQVGTAHLVSYSPSERSILSLALVGTSIEVGDEVVLQWGEAGGGYGDGVVAPDAIREIRGIVSPAPYSRVAREEYRSERQATAST